MGSAHKGVHPAPLPRVLGRRLGFGGVGAGGCHPERIKAAPSPSLSFIPLAFAFSSPSLFSIAVSKYWNGLGGRVLHLKARRCASGSYGSALPSSPAPLIRRNEGEVFFAQACEASRHCACGARHRAVRLHDLEVGVDIRLYRQHLCGNVSRFRSTRVCIPHSYSLLYIYIA